MDDGKMLIDVTYFAQLVAGNDRLNAIIDYLEYNNNFSEASVILAIAGNPYRAKEKKSEREESWKKLVEEEKKNEGTESEAYQN